METKALLLEERGKSLKEKKRSLGQVCWVFGVFVEAERRDDPRGALMDRSIHHAANTHAHTLVHSIKQPPTNQPTYTHTPQCHLSIYHATNQPTPI